MLISSSHIFTSSAFSFVFCANWSIIDCREISSFFNCAVNFFDSFECARLSASNFALALKFEPNDNFQISGLLHLKFNFLVNRMMLTLRAARERDFLICHSVAPVVSSVFDRIPIFLPILLRFLSCPELFACSSRIFCNKNHNKDECGQRLRYANAI